VAGDQVGIGGKVRRVVAQAVAGKKLEGGGGAFKAGSEPGTPPMPGVLVKYLVSEGEFLKSGAPIAVLSAMKMEHTIRAGKGGRVLKLLLNPGESVKKGQKLIELEEE
jgi:3-methylcrotonyl-CoA carboxylase alpha subunit